MIDLNEHDLYKLSKSKKDIIIKNQLYKYINKGGMGIIFKINENEVIKIYFKNLNSNQMIELICLKLCKKALDKNLTFNLVSFNENKIINNKMIISLEYCDYDLEKWLLTPKDDIEWLSMIFQICNGVYILNKKLNIKHDDLKPKNILCKKIKSKKIVKYKIFDTEFYVPVYTIFKIADFAGSTNKKCNDLSDLKHLSILNNRAKADKIVKKYTKDKLIDMAKDLPNFKNYFNEKITKINKTFKNYPIYVIEKMITKSIAYFLIENFKINDKEINNLDPSLYIIKELEKFKDITYKQLFNNKIFKDFKIKKDFDDFYDCDQSI